MAGKQRILIVGGVAGGASCAARARRLCESCEIVIFDKGPHVSFANCGLPYFVGDVITDEAKLLVATPDRFRKRFNIQVHTETEVLSIDRRRREIEVRDLQRGETRTERYDALVLSPGAAPVRPPLPGIDLPGIHVLRTIPDSKRIRRAAEGASSAVVVGGGFIGVEMAENLRRRGLEVTLVEMAPQVLPPFDPEMAVSIADRLRENGVRLELNTAVAAFEPRDALPGSGLWVRTAAGGRLSAEFVVLAIGVRPEARLAIDAGLELGKRGGIHVDSRMRTNDPRIWAVGDAVEVHDLLIDTELLVPLAGPANRQGRIAADDIIRGEAGSRGLAAPANHFRGVQGTAICGVFGLTAAITGASETALQRSGTPYARVYLHPGNHVSYYPGATAIDIKLLFAPDDGRILGAQAIGEEGAARRVDVISMAIQMGGTVFDLEQAELCYAPQFGAAKDPVNLAGMVAANHLRGDLPLARWEDLEATDAQIVDVRTRDEFEAGHLEGAVNLPLDALRDRIEELPGDRPIWLVCEVGQRAYIATRVLLQRGYDVKNLPGGMNTYAALRGAGAP